MHSHFRQLKYAYISASFQLFVFEMELIVHRFVVNLFSFLIGSIIAYSMKILNLYLDYLY